MFLTAIIALGCAVVPQLYNRRADGLGNVLAMVLLVALLIGAGIGSLWDGVDGALRGALIAVALFLIAATLSLSILHLI